jgi:hypothetical protein
MLHTSFTVVLNTVFHGTTDWAGCHLATATLFYGGGGHIALKRPSNCGQVIHFCGGGPPEAVDFSLLYIIRAQVTRTATSLPLSVTMGPSGALQALRVCCLGGGGSACQYGKPGQHLTAPR